MGIDNRTLVLVLGLTNLIQLAVFAHQYLVNKTFRGINWWLLWGAAEAAGFAFMLLRGIPSFLNAAIIAQNALIVAGVIFLYIGIMRFFDKKEDRALTVSFFAVYLAALVFFLFVKDDIRIRSAIVSSALAVVSLFSARALLSNKYRDLSASVNFISATFIIHGCYHAVRAAMILYGAPCDDPFAPTPLNTTAYLDGIIFGNIWAFGFIILINQRLNAEATDSKKEIELFFDTSPDAISITRMDDGSIVKVNEGFCALLGFTKEETLKKTVFEIGLWENTADRLKLTGELQAKGSCENFEAVFLRKDGSQFTGLMSAKVINLKNVPHIITVTHDITSHKHLEQIRGDVLHNVNHELRRPITTQVLALDYLRTELGATLSAQHLAVLTTALKAAHSMTRLVEDLLEVTRSETGKLVIRPERTDLSELAADIVAVMAPFAGKQGLRFGLEAAAGLPPANADPARVKQIIGNLVDNAFKFTPAGGQVILKVQFAADAADMLEVSVSDTGQGIDKPDLEKIFDRLYQTSNLSRKFTKGLGLGLHICKLLVEKQGGRIWIESEPGKGSVFHFTLPALGRTVTGAQPEVGRA